MNLRLKSFGITPRALHLAVLEPAKFRRKWSLLLPLGIIVLFSFWSVAVMSSMFQDDSVGNDPNAMIINIVQLGGFMVPLLIGSSILILTGGDKDTGMLTRIQTFGLTAREIGFSKSLWGTFIACIGIVGVILTTWMAGSSSGAELSGNYLVILVFGFAAEVLCLVPAFLNLAMRRHGQAAVLAFSLVGSLLGSAGHFMPRMIAGWIPFTFVGAVSPVRVNADGFFDAPLSVVIPLIVFIATLIIGSISIALFPRRLTND